MPDGVSELDKDTGVEGTCGNSLVIPAYNEEERIHLLLEDISGEKCDFIFICDGKDRTADKIREYMKSEPDMKIRCIEHPQRIGKGMAIREGLSLATSVHAGYMDADGSTSFRQMMELFRQLDGADAVIGSRWISGSKVTTDQGFLRRMESRIFNIIARIFFGIPYRDTQCGAKVFRTAALREVLPFIISGGFEFDVELIWRLRKAGYLVREYPIEWRNIGGSRVRGPDGFSMLRNLMMIRFGKG